MREFSALARGAFYRIKENPEVESIILSLSAGDEVVLVPEPTNRFDPNAIQIHFESTNIAFVGKEWAAIIAPLITEGHEYTAKIDYFESTMSPVIQIIFPDLDEE